MKYKDGYLCGEEELEQLPVEILEDVIIRIHRDSYLSRDSKRDLLKTYLVVRKWKLDKAFQYTEENLRRLREMNELIERQSVDAIRTAYQVYQEELKVKTACPDEYVDVEIKPQLKVPHSLYYRDPDFIFTEKEERRMRCAHFIIIGTWCSTCCLPRQFFIPLSRMFLVRLWSGSACMVAAVMRNRPVGVM